LGLNNYKGKKIVVTGHTGFKGSWLTFWLRELGADVIGISLDPYTPEDFFCRTDLGNKITDIRLNILDLNQLIDIFKKYQPDFVFHLAAQPIVRLSYDQPLETFQTNINGTANVLEAIRQTLSIQAGIFITTDKVYQNLNTIWGYREIDPLGGYDPYSASKACAEIIIDSYFKSYFASQGENPVAKIASTRAGNVIGGGDWQKDRIIPDCMRALLNNQSILIRNPQSVRPWQYVLDVLSGYLVLGEKMLGNSLPEIQSPYAHSWNFGPFFESAITVENLVKKVISTWGSGEYEIEEANQDNKHESQLLTLDISKAMINLKWHPALNIDESIKFTIVWYKFASQNPGLDLYDFSVNQLNEYLSIAKFKQICWASED
jgi:CDP-glucose 4,6-dehydratase